MELYPLNRTVLVTEMPAAGAILPAVGTEVVAQMPAARVILRPAHPQNPFILKASGHIKKSDLNNHRSVLSGD